MSYPGVLFPESHCSLTGRRDHRGLLGHGKIHRHSPCSGGASILEQPPERPQSIPGVSAGGENGRIILGSSCSLTCPSTCLYGVVLMSFWSDFEIITCVPFIRLYPPSGPQCVDGKESTFQASIQTVLLHLFQHIIIVLLFPDVLQSLLHCWKITHHMMGGGSIDCI